MSQFEKDPTSEIVARIGILLQASGFRVSLRHGYCWMEFPDGFATHIVALAGLPALDGVDLFVADLCATSGLRQQALDRVRAEATRCGWELEECSDGIWVLRSGGASSVVAVDWTLTDDLRVGGLGLVSSQLRQRLFNLNAVGPYIAAFRGLGDGQMGEPSRQIPDGSVFDAAPQMQASPATINQARKQASDPPLSDDDLDRWSLKHLMRWRQRFESRESPLRLLLEPCWLVGDSDWISREELLARLEIYCRTIRWPGFGQLMRLRMGDSRNLADALMEWDEWESANGCDGDVHGFCEMAAYFYAEREFARLIVREMEGWRGVERAIIAGQPSALHYARAMLSNSLNAVSQSEGEQREHEVYGLFEVLARGGELVARIVVDEDEAKLLRAICIDVATRWSERGWATVINMLHVACHFGWSDVAARLLESECGIELVLSGSPEFEDPDWNLVSGALALSVLAPAKAANLVVRPACERLRVTTVARRKDDEDMLALAISWWRCRNAQGTHLDAAHSTV